MKISTLETLGAPPWASVTAARGTEDGSAATVDEPRRTIFMSDPGRRCQHASAHWVAPSVHHQGSTLLIRINFI